MHAVAASPVRTPRQARSRATLERIVSATIELLETRTFDEISVTEIVGRARSSVGAFYARFEDKAALLDHLDERYTRRVLQLGERAARETTAADSLSGEVRGLVTYLLRLHRLHPGLLRTLIVEARRQGEGRFRERTRRMNRTIPPVMDRLLEHSGEMAHPDPERGVYLGLLMVFSTIREVVLFPEGLAEFVRYRDDALIEELTRAYLRYLGAEDRT